MRIVGCVLLLGLLSMPSVNVAWAEEPVQSLITASWQQEPFREVLEVIAQKMSKKLYLGITTDNPVTLDAYNERAEALLQRVIRESNPTCRYIISGERLIVDTANCKGFSPENLR